MNTIMLDPEKIYCGTLVLVNAAHPCRSGHADDLVPADNRFPKILLDHEAAEGLQRLLEEIAAGTAIVPVSGYRSFEEQSSIYQSSLEDNGEEFTKKYVAVPNHSEHQTGLAIDLGLCQKEIDFLRPEFPYDGICGAFRAAAPDFGFVERYGEGKESITGIAHEPWHFRYVGFPHSKIMKEADLSLEEYIEFLKDYRYDRRYIFGQSAGTEAEIYYIPMDDGNDTVTVSEGGVCQISGNNVDGFIVTVWRKRDGRK